MPQLGAGQRVWKVGRAAYSRLAAIQAQMAADHDRQVTQVEVMDELVRRYEVQPPAIVEVHSSGIAIRGPKEAGQ